MTADEAHQVAEHLRLMSFPGKPTIFAVHVAQRSCSAVEIRSREYLLVIDTIEAWLDWLPALNELQRLEVEQ